jgi:hypothetical protein
MPSRAENELLLEICDRFIARSAVPINHGSWEFSVSELKTSLARIEQANAVSR